MDFLAGAGAGMEKLRRGRGRDWSLFLAGAGAGIGRVLPGPGPGCRDFINPIRMNSTLTLTVKTLTLIFQPMKRVGAMTKFELFIRTPADYV